jgi:hypothetical protein
VELDDEDVRPLVRRANVDKISRDTMHELLSLIYHSGDIEVGKGLSTSNIATHKKRYYCDEQESKRGEAVDTCELCAAPGHMKYKCKFRYCVKCRKVGHQSGGCRESKDPRIYELCKRCPSARHSAADCPRGWRKYKLSGEMKECPIYRACPICLSTEHFVDDCSSDATCFSIFTSSFSEYL